VNLQYQLVVFDVFDDVILITILCVCVCDVRRASAADRPIEMPRRSSRGTRGNAWRAPRVLQETVRGRDGILTRNGQVGQTDHGSTQNRETEV